MNAKKYLDMSTEYNKELLVAIANHERTIDNLQMGLKCLETELETLYAQCSGGVSAAEECDKLKAENKLLQEQSVSLKTSLDSLMTNCVASQGELARYKESLNIAEIKCDEQGQELWNLQAENKDWWEYHEGLETKYQIDQIESQDTTDAIKEAEKLISDIATESKTTAADDAGRSRRCSKYHH